MIHAITHSGVGLAWVGCEDGGEGLISRVGERWAASSRRLLFNIALLMHAFDQAKPLAKIYHNICALLLCHAVTI